jgi:hypothetical protein
MKHLDIEVLGEEQKGSAAGIRPEAAWYAITTDFFRRDREIIGISYIHFADGSYLVPEDVVEVVGNDYEFDRNGNLQVIHRGSSFRLDYNSPEMNDATFEGVGWVKFKSETTPLPPFKPLEVHGER